MSIAWPGKSYSQEGDDWLGACVSILLLLLLFLFLSVASHKPGEGEGVREREGRRQQAKRKGPGSLLAPVPFCTIRKHVAV
jgi:hypothetical protein